MGTIDLKSNDRKYLLGLTVSAAGIAYGDLGTSVLYSVRVSFSSVFGLQPTEPNVLGLLSLIFWSLVLVVCLKYMIFILRADADGEGGILVLTSLISPKKKPKTFQKVLIIVGLFGAALLYGDSTITPAITVLSSIEGLNRATPFFQPYIVPITVGILVALFAFQFLGTARIGKAFGKVMVVWFFVIALLGLIQIFHAPQVLKAFNPLWAIDFFKQNGFLGFLVLGAVVLALTGTEALYADIGHFGKKPIRMAWFYMIFPSVTLCYFGEGASILRNPDNAALPFFSMAPEWGIYPLVVLATAAAIIASQSVITGAFSLARQSVLFGDLPRMKIIQTSKKEAGQIYVPTINWMLMVLTILLVVGFTSSDNLAGAYGIAVTGTMVITTTLFAYVMYNNWHWNILFVCMLTILFLTIDLAFFTANIHKIFDGGWFPLMVAAVVVFLMTTWRRGKKILKDHIKVSDVPLGTFIDNLRKYVDINEKIKYVQGIAIYLNTNPMGTPSALVDNVKHNKILHEKIILLSVEVSYEYPFILKNKQLEVAKLQKGIYKVIIRHGFTQRVNIPEMLDLIKEPGLKIDMNNTTFFLSNHLFVSKKAKRFRLMTAFRRQIYDFLDRNQQRITVFFNLPSERVIEIRSEIEI